MKQGESTENVSISTKIPQSLEELVERAVTGGYYLNISNFVREAITEKLRREGYFPKIDNPRVKA
jgi:Arc/MetJ-type ribon-helix-helix transcriptional regulator